MCYMNVIIICYNQVIVLVERSDNNPKILYYNDYYVPVGTTY